MLVFGTEMHIVTLLFILLELVLLGSQLIHYLCHPEKRARFLYLILLVLLIIYNTTSGLFPDAKIDIIPIHVQNILAYGSGFLMASYFPFFFYKAFDLKLLRFHALYGVPLFLLLPYLVFFVFSYSIDQDLDFAIRYGIIIPFFYSFILLRAMFRAIHTSSSKHNKNHYMEKIAVYCAVVPWISMTVFAYINVHQVIELLFTNLGFVLITIFFIFRSVKKTRQTYKQMMEIKNGILPSTFIKNCSQYELTKTEVEVVQMLRQGLTNREISERMYRSEQTVKKHLQHIFRKTEVSSRSALVHKLESDCSLLA